MKFAEALGLLCRFETQTHNSLDRVAVVIVALYGLSLERRAALEVLVPKHAAGARFDCVNSIPLSVRKSIIE